MSFHDLDRNDLDECSELMKRIKAACEGDETPHYALAACLIDACATAWGQSPQFYSQRRWDQAQELVLDVVVRLGALFGTRVPIGKNMVEKVRRDTKKERTKLCDRWFNDAERRMTVRQNTHEECLSAAAMLPILVVLSQATRRPVGEDFENCMGAIQSALQRLTDRIGKQGDFLEPLA